MLAEEHFGNQLSSQALQHIETWLEKTLAESLRLESTPEEQKQQELLAKLNEGNYKPPTAIEKAKIDRSSLASFGIADKKHQDQIYRSFFVYCHGIHDFIRQFTRSSASSPYSSTSELSQTLWGAFFKLFQFYEPSMRLLYQQSLQENASRSKRSFAQNMQEKLSQHVSINEELLYDYKRLEIELSSLRFTSELEALTQQVKAEQESALVAHQQKELETLRRELDHLRRFKVTATRTINTAKSSLNSLLQREQSLSEEVQNLSEFKIFAEKELERLRKSQSQLQAETTSLKDFVYSQKQAVTGLQQELERRAQKLQGLERQDSLSRDLALRLQQQLLQASQSQERVLQFLQSNQTLLGLQYQLVDFLSQSSRLWQQLVQWMRAFRDRDYNNNNTTTTTTTMDASDSSRETLQEILDLFSAMLHHNPLTITRLSPPPPPLLPLAPSSSSGDDSSNSHDDSNRDANSDDNHPLATSLSQQWQQLQDLSLSYEELLRENQHFSCSAMSSLLELLQSFFSDLSRQSEEVAVLQRLQRRAAASETLSQVYGAVLERLDQSQSRRLCEVRQLSQRLQQRDQSLLLCERELRRLEGVEEQRSQLQTLLDRSSLQLERAQREQTHLRQSLSSLEILRSTLQQQLEPLSRQVARLEADLADREAFVLFLQQDCQRRLKEQAKQVSSAAVYETLLPGLEQVLQTVERLQSIFREHQRQNKALSSSFLLPETAIAEASPSSNSDSSHSHPVVILSNNQSDRYHNPQTLRRSLVLSQQIEKLPDYQASILLCQENLRFNEDLALPAEEVTRLLNILEALLQLPRTFEEMMLSTDKVHDLRAELERCRQEVDVIKTHSAKERRRLLSQYEEQLQQARDLFLEQDPLRASFSMRASMDGFEGKASPSTIATNDNIAGHK